MKTQWHQEWVIGFTANPDQAEKLIKQGLNEGFDKNQFSLIYPKKMERKPLAGIMPEPLHPERLRIAVGALIGFLMGSLGFLLFSSGNTASEDPLIEIAAALVCGIGGTILGAVIAVYFGIDTSLSTFYDQHDDRTKIMIALSFDPRDQEGIEKGKKLFESLRFTPYLLPPSGGTPRHHHEPLHHIGS